MEPDEFLRFRGGFRAGSESSEHGGLEGSEHGV